jgi:hypothetical protein
VFLSAWLRRECKALSFQATAPNLQHVVRIDKSIDIVAKHEYVLNDERNYLEKPFLDAL